MQPARLFIRGVNFLCAVRQCMWLFTFKANLPMHFPVQLFEWPWMRDVIATMWSCPHQTNNKYTSTSQNYQMKLTHCSVCAHTWELRLYNFPRKFHSQTTSVIRVLIPHLGPVWRAISTLQSTTLLISPLYFYSVGNAQEGMRPEENLKLFHVFPCFVCCGCLQ